MIRFLKYLLSLLLLLGLTVTECGVYSNAPTAKFYEVSVHVFKTENKWNDIKTFAYVESSPFHEQFDLPRISYAHQERATKIKVRNSQKVGRLLYERIKLSNAESAFLIQKISAQNIHCNLYMA